MKDKVYTRSVRAVGGEAETFTHEGIEKSWTEELYPVCSVKLEGEQFVFTPVTEWSSPGFYAINHTLNIWQRFADGSKESCDLLAVEMFYS